MKSVCQRSLPHLQYHEDLHPTPNTFKNENHLVSGRIKIGRAKGSELSVETKIEVIGYELLTNWLRVASDHMKTEIYEKEQNPEMTQRTSERNQLHCNNGSPPKTYDDSSPSKWREKKFEMETPDSTDRQPAWGKG